MKKRALVIMGLLALLTGIVAVPAVAGAISADGEIVMEVYDDHEPEGDWINAGKLAKLAWLEREADLEANGNCVSYHCANYVYAEVIPDLVAEGVLEEMFDHRDRWYVRRAQ